MAEKREKSLEAKEGQLEKKREELDNLVENQMKELQRISGLSKEDAKAITF